MCVCGGGGGGGCRKQLAPETSTGYLIGQLVVGDNPSKDLLSDSLSNKKINQKRKRDREKKKEKKKKKKKEKRRKRKEKKERTEKDEEGKSYWQI